MKPKVGIIGRGNVGGALERGLVRSGHEVKMAGRVPEEVRAVGAWADVVVLAVPFAAIDDALLELGPTVNGKVLIDTTNALDKNMRPAFGPDKSGAEELQKKAPSAKVVKAFNTVFAQNMDTGHVDGQQITAFVAGGDIDARRKVASLASEIGFDAVDAGPLENARWLESMGYFSIQLAYKVGMGPGIGIRLIHPSGRAVTV